MVADVAAGRAPRAGAKFGQLIDEVLEVIDLDFTTRGMYEGYIARTIRPALADYDVRHLEQHPELLDKLYARLRKCRRLCGGRRGLVDHRPAGRGKRLSDGTPDHECDERCRPHQCRPAEPATIAQVHAIIKGFLGYAVRWKWINENPAANASPPEVTAEHDDPPSPDEAVRLLAAAEDHSRVMAVVTWLALTTGARRGELCALRWPDRLHLIVPAVLSALGRSDWAQPFLPTMAGVLTAAAVGDDIWEWRAGLGPVSRAETAAWCYTAWLMADLTDSAGFGEPGTFSRVAAEIVTGAADDEDPNSAAPRLTCRTRARPRLADRIASGYGVGKRVAERGASRSWMMR